MIAMKPELKLKGGNVTFDKRLDRLAQFDERSRAYPIRALVPKTLRSYTWSVGAFLDQGQEGACVGFAWAHELAARPKINPVSEDLARNRIYKRAQTIDEWPGEQYEGTSVIAGAKIVQKELAGMLEYRWGFGLQDLRLGVGHEGPAVLGVNWYEGMFNTLPDGFVQVAGGVAGGHAILCYSVNNKEKYFRLHNSWGPDWGQKGTCKVRFQDMERLLDEQGEACFPVKRQRIELAPAG
jgi:Papain family cysteine protease